MTIPDDATRQPAPVTKAPEQRDGRLRNRALLLLLITYAAVVAWTAWLADDAYITLRTVDNFVSGHGLRWNVAERVQTFTHPLWMLLLSALYFFTREAYLTTLGASWAVSIAAVSVVARRAIHERLPLRVVVPGIGILIASKAFTEYSTSGLENPLTHLLLAVFSAQWLANGATAAALPAVALCAGLATLNRMDTILLFLPALVWQLWHWASARRFLVTLLAFTPFLVWEVFSVIYYGLPFPNTAYAKLNTGVSRLDARDLGLAYFWNSLAHDPITLLAIAGSLIACARDRSRKTVPLVAGALLYLAYVLYIGGDFMSGRFFAAPLLIAVIVLIEVGGHASAAPSLRLLPSFLLVIVISLSVAQRLGWNGGNANADALVDAHGIADERAFYYPVTGLWIDTPIAQRPSGHAANTGRRARRRGDPLIVSGAVGFQGFLAGPSTYVLDYHALGDPLLARLPMVKVDPYLHDFCLQFRGWPCVRPWRAGHYLRNVPPGYLDSILSGENRLADTNLHRLYDQVRLITRGPIWSLARWRAILDLHLGRSGNAAAGTAVGYEPTDFTATDERNPDTSSLSVLVGAASAYQQAQRLDLAFECYRKAIALDPDDGVALGKYGTALAQAGQLTDAIESYRSALRAEPELVGVRFNLGSALLQIGQLDEGILHLRAAVQARPGYAEAHTNLGVALMRSGRIPEAIDSFRTAVRLRPEMPEAHFSYGVALAEAGRLQEALAQLHEALRLRPDYPRAQQQLQAVQERIAQAKQPAAAQ
jgi:arabinofuranosyltransferase